jgi:hypothetical protein
MDRGVTFEVLQIWRCPGAETPAAAPAAPGAAVFTATLSASTPFNVAGATCAVATSLSTPATFTPAAAMSGAGPSVRVAATSAAASLDAGAIEGAAGDLRSSRRGKALIDYVKLNEGMCTVCLPHVCSDGSTVVHNQVLGMLCNALLSVCRRLIRLAMIHPATA